MLKEWEMKNSEKDSENLTFRKRPGKGSDEDRDCNGMTALRETWKEWEENGEQQEKIQNAVRE